MAHHDNRQQGGGAQNPADQRGYGDRGKQSGAQHTQDAHGVSRQGGRGQGDYGHGTDGHYPRGAKFAGHGHDDDYARWRERELAQCDADYDAFRQQHPDASDSTDFDSTFETWRRHRRTGSSAGSSPKS